MSRANKAALAVGAQAIRKAEAEAQESKSKAITTTAKFHPAVEWLPELSESEYQELRDDIKARGLREPILIKSGYIIDGRHRLKACRELGIEPKFKEYTGNDILAEILSRNLLRRHLTADQRAMLVAKLRGNKLSDEALVRKKSGVSANLALKSAEGGRTDEQIAKEAGVGRDKARAALDVVKHAPEAVDDVIKGKKKLRDVKPKKKAKKKRARPEPPPYEPKPDEQRALDAIEKQAKKLAGLITPEITHVAMKLDSQANQRWLDMFAPLMAFHGSLYRVWHPRKAV